MGPSESPFSSHSFSSDAQWYAYAMGGTEDSESRVLPPPLPHFPTPTWGMYGPCGQFRPVSQHDWRRMRWTQWCRPVLSLFRYQLLVGLTRKAYWRRCHLNRPWRISQQQMRNNRRKHMVLAGSDILRLGGVCRREAGSSQKCRQVLR